MEADEWPRAGIGDGRSYGTLVGSVPSGVRRLEEINCWKDGRSGTELGGRSNNESGTNCEHERTFGERNAAYGSLAYDPFEKHWTGDTSMVGQDSSVDRNHGVCWQGGLVEDNRLVDNVCVTDKRNGDYVRMSDGGIRLTSAEDKLKNIIDIKE